MSTMDINAKNETLTIHPEAPIYEEVETMMTRSLIELNAKQDKWKRMRAARDQQKIKDKKSMKVMKKASKSPKVAKAIKTKQRR